ncbi:hypothetical protein ACU4HD_31390 [Cupriavidus basilensis]
MIDSDYSSVTERSAIRAGAGGYQTDVKGNTDLKRPGHRQRDAGPGQLLATASLVEARRITASIGNEQREIGRGE